MRFSMPYLPCEFEIPDDWLSEAGFTGFRPNGSAYRSSVPALCVPLTQIEPIVRNVTQPKDFAGFERGRLVHLLKRIVAGDEIDPVDGMKLPSLKSAESLIVIVCATAFIGSMRQLLPDSMHCR